MIFYKSCTIKLDSHVFKLYYELVLTLFGLVLLYIEIV